MWTPNTVSEQTFVVRMKWNWFPWCCVLPWWQMTPKQWCLRLGRENRSAWRFCAPQMQPVLTWKWTQVSTVKSRTIIAWALIITGYVAVGETFILDVFIFSGLAEDILRQTMIYTKSSKSDTSTAFNVPWATWRWLNPADTLSGRKHRKCPL